MSDFLDGAAGVGKFLYDMEKQRMMSRYAQQQQLQQQQQPSDLGTIDNTPAGMTQQNQMVQPLMMRNMRRYGVQQSSAATPGNPLGVGAYDDENGY